jgi:hypothetical protein
MAAMPSNLQPTSFRAAWYVVSASLCIFLFTLVTLVVYLGLTLPTPNPTFPNYWLKQNQNKTNVLSQGPSCPNSNCPEKDYTGSISRSGLPPSIQTQTTSMGGQEKGEESGVILSENNC